MANYFPAQAKVTPSFSEPELIVTYAQASGAFAALQGGKPRVKLGNEDLYVYVNHLDVRTESLSAQQPSNFLPSASLVADYFSTQTYLVRCRAIWDHHEMAQAANYAVALPGAQDLAMRQGIYLQMRSGLLYGFTPGNNEGLTNAQGATAVTLPPDSFGHTTVSTYDSGQMALWLLGEIVALKTAAYQFGVPNRIVAIGPQRILGQLSYQSIVQVVSYQRPGAGTSTSLEVVQAVAKDNGDTFEWYYDDTLIGKGTGGADLVILTIPEVEAPTIPGINTNVFGNDMKPRSDAVNVMYADMAAPMKIPTPIPDGAITEIQEIRVSAGWNWRPQLLFLLSMPH